MPLKVEIIPANDDNPLYLIINDDEIYPVKNVSFKGKNDKIEKNVTESFSFHTGLLFFVDIFDQPHCYTNFENENHDEENKKVHFWF